MFGEMFGDIFGGGRAAADARRCFVARTSSTKLEIDLNQAVFGHSVEIDVAKLTECETAAAAARPRVTSPSPARPAMA
jgi:molecular chaperone DnaJ